MSYLWWWNAGQRRILFLNFLMILLLSGSHVKESSKILVSWLLCSPWIHSYKKSSSKPRACKSRLLEMRVFARVWREDWEGGAFRRKQERKKRIQHYFMKSNTTAETMWASERDSLPMLGKVLVPLWTTQTLFPTRPNSTFSLASIHYQWIKHAWCNNVTHPESFYDQLPLSVPAAPSLPSGVSDTEGNPHVGPKPIKKKDNDALTSRSRALLQGPAPKSLWISFSSGVSSKLNTLQAPPNLDPPLPAGIFCSQVPS